MEEKRKFIIITETYDGTGFAWQEICQNGSEVIVAYKNDDIADCNEDEEEGFSLQGDGMFEKVELDLLMEDREEYRDWYWIFDLNCHCEEGEILHKEGFKVLGGSEFTWKLENDREFGLEFAQSVGFVLPEYKEFTSIEEGIKFLETNEDKAYVYKPDDQDSAYTTMPQAPEPKNANIEIREVIKALGFTNYLLQEKVKGVEVNVETIYQNGLPIITQANFECKKLHQGNEGSPCGCAFDVCFIIDNYCPLALQTVRMFDEKMLEMQYNGPMDCNVIIGDDGPKFLEFCGRWGYNAHPNLFINLCRKTALQFMADLLDGNASSMDFRPGFGASVTLFCDHHKPGLPVHVPESIEKNFYPFFVYINDDDQMVMSGYSKEVGIICAHGYTIGEAFEDAMQYASQIVYTNRHYRKDCDKRDYDNSPLHRYDALISMKLL